MSANGDGTSIPVVNRPPYEREQALAAKRAELVAAGLPLNGFDAVLGELREQEQKMLAGLSEWATLVVASFATEHGEELRMLPAAVQQGLIVRATVAYLYGYGLMTPAVKTGEDAWHPLSWRDAVPEHLRPDVGQAVRGYERLLDALHQVPDRLRPGAGATAGSVPIGTPLQDPPPPERA